MSQTSQFQPLNLPLPGEDLRAWASQFTAVLQQALTATEVSLPIYSSSGNVIIDYDGAYVYDPATGLPFIQPTLVEIDTEHLVDAAVTTIKIANTAVDTNKLADLAVEAAKLANASVSYSKFIYTGGVSSITISVAGTGYAVGEALTFSGGGGSSAAGIITEVGSGGEIEAVSITNQGLDYTSPPTVGVTTSGGSGATLTAAIGSYLAVNDAAIGAAAIAAAAIGTAHIGNAVITTALIKDLAVVDAKIDSLTVNKLTAGTLSVGVTLTGTLVTSGAGYVGGKLVVGANSSGMDNFAEAQDVVRAPSIGIKINTANWNVSNPGEAYIHGFDGAGAAADIDGAIVYNGAVVTIDRAQVDNGGNAVYSVITQQANTKGYIVYDTAETQPFTMNITPTSYSNIAFCKYESGVWYYDASSGWNTVSVTDAMIVIGTLETGATDTILNAQVWQYAQSMRVVGEAGGTYAALTTGTTIDSGGLILNAGGAVKTINKDSLTDTTDGVFLGYDSVLSRYGINIGDGSTYLRYNESGAGNLDIVGGTITAGLIRTAASGVRIELDDTDGHLHGYTNLAECVTIGLHTIGVDNNIIEVIYPYTGIGIYASTSGTSIKAVTDGGTSEAAIWGETSDEAYAGYFNATAATSVYALKVDNSSTGAVAHFWQDTYNYGVTFLNGTGAAIDVYGGSPGIVIDADPPLEIVPAASSAKPTASDNDGTLRLTSAEVPYLRKASKWQLLRHIGFMGCLVYRDSSEGGQGIGSGGWDGVEFGYETYDTDGFHSTVSNTDQIVIPSGLGIKKVRCVANVQPGDASPATEWYARISKNGNSIVGGGQVESNPAKCDMNVSSGVIECTDGDVFRLEVYQNSGSTKNIYGGTYTWFSLEVVEVQ